MAHNYVLHVTAGSTYEPKTHKIVDVNSPTPLSIKDDHTNIDMNIRIQNYHGLPRNSPVTSKYFDLHQFKTHQYSIAFSFTPTSDINGDDLVFGNDFDQPIRYRLPPGFGTALKIVQWAVDPGLECDVYADQPWLYGRFLSSIDTLSIGSKETKGENAGAEEEEEKTFDERYGVSVHEGAIGEGAILRGEKKIPATSAARKKFFLTEKNRKDFTFEAGKEIRADFGNGYLDFNEFSLRLPGFHLPIMNYWDGQPLRYVLKNRSTDEVYLVVCFMLYLKEDVNEDGTLKPGVEKYQGKPPSMLKKQQEADTENDDDQGADDNESDDDDFTSAKGASMKGEGKKDDMKENKDETNADDVD